MGGKALNRQSGSFDVGSERDFLAATEKRAKVAPNMGERNLNWKSDGFPLWEKMTLPAAMVEE